MYLQSKNKKPIKKREETDMVKNLRNRLHESKGFSLVELIVVIAIMVILIALLVPNVVGYISKAQDSANLSAAKSIYNAANTCVIDWKAQNGGYPSAKELGGALYDSTNPAESLAVVPKGTTAAIGYDGLGNVWAVAVGSTSDSTKYVDDANTKNVQAYAPTASGNVYTTESTHASGARYIDHSTLEKMVSCIAVTGAGDNNWKKDGTNVGSPASLTGASADGSVAGGNVSGT
jgi:type IV pilus assembly protein PilA